jgi:hypothetical protein
VLILPFLPRQDARKAQEAAQRRVIVAGPPYVLRRARRARSCQHRGYLPARRRHRDEVDVNITRTAFSVYIYEYKDSEVFD